MHEKSEKTNNCKGENPHRVRVHQKKLVNGKQKMTEKKGRPDNRLTVFKGTLDVCNAVGSHAHHAPFEMGGDQES